MPAPPRLLGLLHLPSSHRLLPPPWCTSRASHTGSCSVLRPSSCSVAVTASSSHQSQKVEAGGPPSHRLEASPDRREKEGADSHSEAGHSVIRLAAVTKRHEICRPFRRAQ